jgi:hypothetical protein
MDDGRPLKRVVFMDICSFSSHLIDEVEDDNTEGKERRGEGEGEGEQEGQRANEEGEKVEEGEEGEENQK